MGRRGMFPGTFDPVTLGHVDIMVRSLRVFDEIVVAVADRHHKKTTFDAETRIAMIGESLPGEVGDRIQVEVFTGLLVEFARQKNVDCLIRGLRVISDFEYEFQMAYMNQGLAPELETIFLAPQPRFSFINSTLVKEVARYGGSLSGLVSPHVERRLRRCYGTDSGERQGGGSVL
jgi:pantetheine-phosphate adenylyltransferase